jgi:NTE family protein
MDNEPGWDNNQNPFAPSRGSISRKVICMPRRLAFFSMLAVSLLVTCDLGLGQEPSERPRIGLCLAGGGARGGAHIGVLKVMEELHIPVDFIAGTSIGSIIGGLYASGMSPAEMDSIMAGIDWFALFDDAPQRKLTNFRRKEEDRIPLFGLELGIGANGIKMPAGLVGGQKLNFLLRKLTLPAVSIDDFDDLPIPFRAVASSLDDGSVVVLSHGSMADAMRASMAIPGAFAPHEIEGQTLIDGGMLRNVPYDVVKAMGADIIIVVDVTKPLDDLKTDMTMMTVLWQTVELTIQANALVSRKEMSDTDVLLVPDLSGIGVESFQLMAEAAERGVTVATENILSLRELSLPEAEYESWRSRLRSELGDGQVLIDDVKVEESGRVDPRRVGMQVRTQAGEPLNLDILQEDISRIYRLGEFELVDYSIQAGSQREGRDLVIKTRDKRWGPNYLRFGLSLSGNFDGQSEFIGYVYHRMAYINRLGAEWRNIGTVGDLLSLDTEFYQPLTMSGRFFVAPRFAGYIEKRERWVEPDQAETVSSRQYSGNLDLGLNISHFGELRIGAYAGHYSGNGENDSLDLDEALGGWHSRLVFDLLDDYDFPNRGWYLNLDNRLSREDLGATTSYDRLSIRYRGVVSRGRTALVGKFEGGTSFKTELPFYDRFELGGFTRLSGYVPGSIYGDDAAALSLGTRVRILEMNPALGNNLYLGLSGEAGRVWNHTESRTQDDILFGVTAFLGMETPVGPIYAGYGWTEPDQQSFYLMLGRTI